MGGKGTTDGYRSIDVRRWKRDGLLTPYRFFDWQWSRHDKVVASIGVYIGPDRVILRYRRQSDGEDGEDVGYPVYLDWTECNLGGQRPWFLCPVFGCGRRVAILYGGDVFACRHCYGLAYSCQQESGFLRTLRRMDKICKRLGAETTGIIPRIEYAKKPKGMHWRTFDRLSRQYNDLLDRF